MKANYHAHTPRCRHAVGSEEEYVLAAIEGGWQTFGFADHSPWNYDSGFVGRIRMRPEELADYVRCVREAGVKHADKVKVLCGLECEYFPKYLPWILEKKEELRLDYLILGNHFDQTDEGGFYFGSSVEYSQIKRYLDTTVAGMQTGAFLYLAHPDLFLARYPSFDDGCLSISRELCRAAKALDIPLEYNLLGRLYGSRGKFGDGLGYPCERFWEIAAQEGVRCVIGVDAHDPAHVLDDGLFNEASAYLSSLGLRREESLL